MEAVCVVYFIYITDYLPTGIKSRSDSARVTKRNGGSSSQHRGRTGERTDEDSAWRICGVVHDAPLAMIEAVS